VTARGLAGPGDVGTARRWAFLVVSIATAWTDARAAEPPPKGSSAAGTAEPAPPSPSPSPSPPSAYEVPKVDCFKHHENAQIARRERRLLDARSELLACSRASCPAAIRSDCVDWIEQVTRSVPSVVVAARARGRDLADVRVSIDGNLVAERLSGAAFEIDPGEHLFRFESPPWPPVERTILVSEGVKGRAIDIEFAPPLPAPGAPKAPEIPRPALSRRLTMFDYVVGGAAAASLATSAAAAGWGLWSRHRLDETCAPFCSSDEKNSVRIKLIVADVALGVTVVSVLVFYFRVMRPVEPDPPSTVAASGLSLLMTATANEARLGVKGAF
jgi:hypothetical protein